MGAGLTLFDDGKELRLEAVLAETRDADDALTLVRSGLLRGYSVEFDAGADEWAWRPAHGHGRGAAEQSALWIDPHTQAPRESRFGGR